MEQVTIRDIARKCKVGVSTVSRAMNNHPDINPETKEMILKVIAESNYVPEQQCQKPEAVECQSDCHSGKRHGQHVLQQHDQCD